MVSKFFTKCCVLVMVLSLSIAEATELFNNKQQIAQKLNELIHYYNVPGVVLSYGFHDNPLTTVAVGYKNLTEQNPMVNDTLFLCGSITKSLIATIILQLIEQNKIQLNETLKSITARYKSDNSDLASFVEKYPVLGIMTIKQLLNHTSGVPEAINTIKFKQAFIKNRNQYWDDRQLLELAMQHPIYFKPGALGKWSYTNTDYILLSMAIQSITGKTIVDQIRLLLKKVNLSNTYFPKRGIIPSLALKKLAIGYLPINSKNDLKLAFSQNPVLHIPGNNNIEAFEVRDTYNIFSSLISTPRDLANWYRILFEGELLSTQSIFTMLDAIPNAIHNKASYGLGVALHFMPTYGYVISHDGLQPGYTSIVMYFIRYKLVISLATNSSNPYVSTFDVHNGKIVPGFITELLPLLVKHHVK